MKGRLVQVSLLLAVISAAMGACSNQATTESPQLVIEATPTTEEASPPSPEPTEADTQPVLPSATTTPTPLSKSALIASLSDHPQLNPENISAIQPLGDFNVAEEVMTFSFWAWSRDGRWLALAYPGLNGEIVIYDLEELGQEIIIPISARTCKSAEIAGCELAFSRDGMLFAGPMEAGGYGIYQTASGELQSTLTDPFAVQHVAFSSQGTRLAASVFHYSAAETTSFGSHDSISLYDVDTGGLWGLFLDREWWYITDLEYSTEGQYLVVASQDGVEAWHVEGGQLPRLECTDAEITFSPVAEEAALSCHPSESDGLWEQMIWNLNSGDLTPLSGGPTNRIVGTSYSLDGSLLVGISESGWVSIWDAYSGEHLLTLDGHFERGVDAAFVHDGRALAVLDRNGQITLYGIP